MEKIFLKLAAVYFCVGVILGITMGIMHNFSLTSVHAHINLLGWVSMALFGLIYHFYPKASGTKLAKTHFWLYNIGFPIMQLGIAMQITVPTVPAFLPITIVSSLLVVISVLLFAMNLFKQLQPRQ
ncbi:cbb3-type cytochrome c oxidase subunit I [Paenibacillus silviterrae]|uniref:cbb3-type cytochrome c oxidase subunit I n=1 Tax=Paenibacillus silviterrae TaxID=3242194 RepID=UPI002542AAF0|nr:cbb3-type cytochrome c oxidase subunit I [Paenibacillus chinjuensis]